MAFIENTLAGSDGDAYGFGGTYGRSATVLNRSDGGVYVRASRGYWLTTSRPAGNHTVKTHTNGVSEAVSFVSTETIRRVAGDGLYDGSSTVSDPEG